MENNKKHLYWVIGLVLITIILCSTLIWINSNAWTIRFEMDDNTKEAVESIEWEPFNEKKEGSTQWSCPSSNETGKHIFSFSDETITSPSGIKINCLEVKQE